MIWASMDPITASTTSTVLAAAISAFVGLLGVVVGSILVTLRERKARREEADRALNVAALRCLARARKIKAADEGTHEEAEQDRKNEIALLGPDLDNYVVAIAAVEDRTTRARHWAIYERTPPILIGQRTENLQSVIEALEQLRGELMEAASTG
jgi:hypothetical protein